MPKRKGQARSERQKLASEKNWSIMRLKGARAFFENMHVKWGSWDARQCVQHCDSIIKDVKEGLYDRQLQPKA